VVYSRVFFSGFVDLDDKGIVNELGDAYRRFSPLEIITQGIIPQNAGETLIYRPITSYTFIIEYFINSADPLLYHITNLTIHVLTCMGLFFLLKKLRFDKIISFLMALVYTVHPLFNQTVAWVPPRADLLMCLFGILSVIALLKYFDKNSWLYFAAHLTAFFVSVFSKETAILFPLLYALFFYFSYYRKSENKLIDIKYMSLMVAWVLIVGIFLYLRLTVMKEVTNPGQFGIGVFLSNIWAIPEFVSKFFIPFNLSSMPQFSIFISSIGIFIIFSLIIFSIVNRKNFNYLSFIGIVWFLVFTAVSMIFHHRHGKVAFDYLEHRAYLPSIGLIIFILSFITEVWKVRAIFTLVPLIFFYSIYSFINIRKYENPIVFYNSIIDGGTNVALAYYGRGLYKGNNGDKQGAIEDFLKAILIKSDYAEAYCCKGNINREIQEYERAIDDYTKAIEFKPDYIEAYLSRSAVYFDRGSIKQKNRDEQGANEDFLLAIDDYTKVVKTKPEHAGAYSNRGDIYFKISRREDAITDYKQAMKLNPQYPVPYNNLGILYATEGNYLESIKYFTKAVECDNKFANAYMNRGLAYLYLGDKKKACENFKLSMEYGSDAGKQLYEKHRLTPE
jgi:tetratricopeptide (TPR) repeat protein